MPEKLLKASLMSACVVSFLVNANGAVEDHGWAQLVMDTFGLVGWPGMAVMVFRARIEWR